MFSARCTESLYTESQDNVNPFLIGSRTLSLHGVTIFTDKDYKKLLAVDYKDYLQ